MSQTNAPDTVKVAEMRNIAQSDAKLRLSPRTFSDDVALARERGVVPKNTQNPKPSFADQFFRRGASSLEAFTCIREVTGDEVDEESDDWIQHYYVSKVQGLTTAFVVACAVGVGGVVVGNWSGAATFQVVLSWLASFVVLAAIIVFGMVNVTKRRIFPRIAQTLDSGRDPVAFCGRYLAYLQVREPSDLRVAFWNYARGLRWQGRWDEARSLMERYIDDYGMSADPKTQHLYHQLLAGIAFDHERCQDLLNEIAYLKSIPASELEESYLKSVTLLEQLAEVLVLERDGKRQEAYDLVESFFYHSENVLRMALALHMGNDSPNRTDALEWIGFVVKMGMSTWCVKRAKAIRSSGRLQKLPAGESRFGMNVRERRKESRRKRKEAAELADAQKSAKNAPRIPR